MASNEDARPRSHDEMTNALRRHIRLLEEFREKVFVEGDNDYAGEIAGKLRLLVTRFGSNRPLLIDLMSETGIEPLITIGGPPIQRRPGRPTAGDQVSLSEYVQLDAIGIRVPSGEFVMLSKEQFIRAWAEQSGSSHEDWQMDGVLSVILGAQVYIGGIHGALAELQVTCDTVLHVAQKFFKRLDEKEPSS